MYQLFGMEISPYSVKVRALLRYKGIPHQWRLRTRDNEADFQAHARLPIIPLLVGPEGQALQDSTPILLHLEQQHPDNSLIIPDAALNFLSFAIEDAADEWLIKAMFHYRWNYEADRLDASMRLAKVSVPEGKDPTNFANAIAAHLMTRREPLGCTEANAEAIEAWLDDVSLQLEQHLSRHRYLFGAHMALADVGLASMYYELYSDPTPRERLSKFSALHAWAHRCMDCTHHEDSEFASWAELSPTLQPLLDTLLMQQYLPWAKANAAAMADSQQVDMDIQGYHFSQPAQKYPAKCWQLLQGHWQSLPADSRGILENALPGIDALLSD